MTILAIMQNMWVRDIAAVQRGLDKYGERYRRKIIRHALFAGCISGKRLQAAFGADLCAAMEWDEASRVITGNPKICPPADPEHIKATIARYQPDIIITFGKIATDAVRPLWNGRLVTAPHPAARQDDVTRRLSVAADELRQAMAIRGIAVVPQKAAVSGD